MTARSSFTEASLRRAITAARRAGLRVVGIRPDGTVIVDEGQGEHPLVPVDVIQPPASKWEDAEA